MDTNVVIGFFDTTLPPAGQRFILGLEPAISVITQIELFSNPRISATELASLTQFMQAATVFNLIDAAIVQQTIAVRLQKKIKTPDAIIAGTALAHGLTLLTRNTADFKQLVGLVLVNPFDLQLLLFLPERTEGCTSAGAAINSPLSPNQTSYESC